MAVPYIFEEDFELGTKGAFDTETDTVSQLDFAHYTELARYPWGGCAPFMGAYAARVVLSGGTADATLTEADVDIAANAGAYFRIPVWFSPTFTGTANDTFVIFECQGAAAAVQVAFGARVVAATNEIQFGIGLATPTSFGNSIERGVWYTIEIFADLDNAGANDGTIDLWVTRAGDPVGGKYVAQLTALDQVAVTDGVLGVQDQLATTTGVMLLGGLTMDDARIYPRERYPIIRTMTKSGHVFVGPGSIASAELLKDAAGNETIQIWDTDRADSLPQQGFVMEMAASEQTSVGSIDFKRGCYLLMSGTAPSARVSLITGDNRRGKMGPQHYSDALVRRWGRQARQG